jgi:serine/threonine-protein kinase
MSDSSPPDSERTRQIPSPAEAASTAVDGRSPGAPAAGARAPRPGGFGGSASTPGVPPRPTGVSHPELAAQGAPPRAPAFGRPSMGSATGVQPAPGVPVGAPGAGASTPGAAQPSRFHSQPRVESFGSTLVMESHLDPVTGQRSASVQQPRPAAGSMPGQAPQAAASRPLPLSSPSAVTPSNPTPGHGVAPVAVVGPVAVPLQAAAAPPPGSLGGGLVLGAPRPQSPSVLELAQITEGLRKHVANLDPEHSVEIPPPENLEPAGGSLPPGAPDPYIGTTFDHRYKIEQLLGEGGMGFVYLARHKVIGKKVAVKVLRSDLARDREILDRFMQEAQAASSIGNPHIIDISDFGQLPDGSTYFVMEFLDGKSLSQVITDTPRMPVERICHIAAQMADGLAAAHAAGIVHRDLKPDNVFVIERGQDHDFVKILDFGIAKVSTGASTKLTRAGAVFGTPHYMSPEQAAGAAIDHRTDVYSLGVMLYELAAGKLPFDADNFMGILTQHMYKAPVPIRALVPAPDCPPGLEAIIMKCLTKKPERRYQSMLDLGADLARLVRSEVPAAVTEMMARSGGFNVPHDYFASHQQKAIVPATPSVPRRGWPRYVWVAGAATAIGLVTAIVVKGSITDASQPPAPSASAVAAPPPPSAAPVASASAAASAAASGQPAAAPKKISVGVTAVPESALLYRDGDTKPAKLPVVLDLEEGKPITVEVRAVGFEDKKVLLDASDPAIQKDPRVVVKLDPAPARGTGHPAAGGVTHPPKKKGGDVVDPWGN